MEHLPYSDQDAFEIFESLRKDKDKLKSYTNASPYVRVRDEYPHPEGKKYYNSGYYERMIPLDNNSNRVLLSMLRTRFPKAEGLYGPDKLPCPKYVDIDDGKEAVYLIIPNVNDIYFVDYRLGEDPVIGIGLSGGGTRAAMMALGAMRRLYELGILRRATTISSVSGGGLVNAVLALNWVELMRDPQPDMELWDRLIASNVRKLCSSNVLITTLALAKNPMTLVKVQIHRHKHHCSTRGPFTSANILSANLCRIIPELTTSMSDLPRGPGIPHFVFCSCDMAAGKAFYYTQNYVGPDMEFMWQRTAAAEGKANPKTQNTYSNKINSKVNNTAYSGGATNNTHASDVTGRRHSRHKHSSSVKSGDPRKDDCMRVNAENGGFETGSNEAEKVGETCDLNEYLWRDLAEKLVLSDAVASSAAFPLAVDPFEININQLLGREHRSNNENIIRLTDGGVYDNLGLDPLLTAGRVAGRKTILFLNDAQADKTMDWKPSSHWIKRNSRVINIISGQLVQDKQVTLKEKYGNHQLDGASWRLQQLGPKLCWMEDDVRESMKFPGQEIFADPEILSCITGFRTDLNELSPMESQILENTGYLISAYRFHRKCAYTLCRLDGKPSGTYFVDFKWPHACGIHGEGVREGLKHSKNLACALVHNNKKKVLDPSFYHRAAKKTGKVIVKSLTDPFMKTHFETDKVHIKQRLEERKRIEELVKQQEVQKQNILNTIDQDATQQTAMPTGMPRM